MESVLIRLLYPTLSKVLAGGAYTIKLKDGTVADVGVHAFNYDERTIESPDPKTKDFTLEARVKNKQIGYVQVYHQGARIYAFEVNVDKAWRRKGVATGLYNLAQDLTGKHIYPNEQGDDSGNAESSDDAIEFWKSRGVDLTPPDDSEAALAKAKAKVEITEFTQGDSVPKDAVALIPKTDALSNYINRDPGVHYKWVAYLKDKPVGLATLESLDIHGLGHIGDTTCLQVFVDKKARGMGIGEKLIKLAAENNPTSHLAGYTNHSDGFEHLSKKYGIRNMDDVGNYDEDSENWQDDGSYEEPEEDF